MSGLYRHLVRPALRGSYEHEEETGFMVRRGLCAAGDRLRQVSLVFVLLHLSWTSGRGAAQAQEAVKGGYWNAGFARVLPPATIASNLFTHLFFAFAQVDTVTFQVVPGSPVTAQQLSGFSQAVKARNPAVKSLISIATDDANVLGNMTAKPESRSVFINSSIALARANGFDGLDLDYEYPRTAENMQLFGEFLQEWRAAVVAESVATDRNALLLTAAVYYASALIFRDGRAYPISSLASTLDFVNLMTYDLHGSWEKTVVNYNAPLFASGRLSISGELSGNYGVQSWLLAGFPPSKLVFGIPAYGVSWILTDVANHTIGSPAIGLGTPQNLSRTPGLFLYREAVEFSNKEGVTTVYDNQSVSSFAYDTTGLWVGFDSPESVRGKIEYAKRWNLRGYYFWSVNYDDPQWTLSKTASNALDGDSPVPAPTPGSSSSPALLSSGVGFVWTSCMVLLMFQGLVC